MAQTSTGTSSVSREPSMEEILASIRRIIEESDTGRPDDALPLAGNSDVPSKSFAFPDSVEPFSEDAELGPREGIAVVQPGPQAYGSELGPEAALGQSRFADRDPVYSPPQPNAPASRLDFGKPAEYQEFTTSEPSVDTALAKPEQIEKLSEPSLEPVVAPVPEPAAMDTHADISTDLERALEPILSESAERQVSAAFEDLSFAVRSEQRRSFDEIAQELMRPLLQEWLDNNLPTLVERLVREEIERVARGGKR